METTTSTDPPALHYLAAITQILHRTDWQSVVLGDFYLSRDQLVYIYYGGFKSSSAVAGGTAALLGGVTGAIANAWTDGAVRDAMPYYTASLRKSWGMSPERRATMWPAIIVKRADVKKWETTGGITFETADGSTHVFGYTDNALQDGIREVLAEWLAGTLDVKDSAAMSGIIPIGKPPYDIIEDAKQDRLPSAETYASCESNEEYARHLVELYMAQKYAVKVRALALFANGPKTLRGLLDEKLEASAGKKERPPFIAVCLLLLGIYMICSFVYRVYVANDSEGHDLLFAVSLFVMPLVSLFSAAVIASWWSRRRDHELLMLLRG